MCEDDTIKCIRNMKLANWISLIQDSPKFRKFVEKVMSFVVLNKEKEEKIILKLS